MASYVKNFIAMSIVYLGLASMLGVGMLWWPRLLELRFVHSHLMMLGWVSMMIYGVSYHILPRFAGRLIKYPKLAVTHFWLSNAGLVGMLVCYTLVQYGKASIYGGLTAAFGVLEAVSMMLFLYNMLVTLFEKGPEAEPGG